MLLSMDLLQVRILNTTIESELNRRLAPVGLTYVQGTVLELLDREGSDETAQITVEQWLGLSRPTVGGILRRLSAKGLVSVTPQTQDRRRNLVEITPTGRTLAHEVTSTLSQLTEELLRGFTAQETTALASLLERATRNLSPR